MILEFSITNFRSFKGKQTFSMIPDGGKDELHGNIAQVTPKLQVLRSAVLYGANASGKSNFMKALQLLRDLVRSSANHTPDSTFSAYVPFKFHPDTPNAPSTFEIDFLLKGIRYQYYVSINSKEVKKEALYFYPHGRKTTLFVRQEEEFEFGDSLKGQKAIVSELTSKNQLFLSKAAQNNIRQLINIYQYFLHDFMSIPFLDSWTDNRYADRIAKELTKKDNEVYIKNFMALLKSFDTGIVDFKIKKRNFPLDGEFEIHVIHTIYDNDGRETGTSSQLIEEESTGTQKLFVLGGIILRALMLGRVIMIDEFERSLHPFISKFILQIFNDSEINRANAQLIIATHDTNLLDKENHLRRDQIWIVEKDKFGASELFSLADIDGIRKDTPYEKWYLSGRLGGVPGVEAFNFKLNFQQG